MIGEAKKSAVGGYEEERNMSVGGGEGEQKTPALPCLCTHIIELRYREGEQRVGWEGEGPFHLL